MESTPPKALFESDRQTPIAQNPKRIIDYPIVKIAPGEEILIAQRRHIVSLIDSIIIETLGLILILIACFSPFAFRYIIPANLYSFTLSIYIALTITHIFLLRQLYVFLSWYYQVYVITNKALIHRMFFRINGEYSETVYGDQMHVQDLTRKATNIFYDYLKIQDIYVHFHKQEREKPFIFKTPSNAQKIDDVIQGLVVASNGAQK